MEVLILSLEQGDFLVVIAGFNLIFARKSISRSHVNSSFYPPSNVIFLKEQPPSSLSVGKILGLFEISQVFVIRYYSYRMFHACEIVAPFF